MSASVLIVCFILAISLHELGHAFAMRKYGAEIKEMSLIGFGPILFQFRLRKYFGDTPIRIRAIPFGAYVALTQKGGEVIESLPHLARSEIHGAGAVANLAMAVALWGMSVFTADAKGALTVTASLVVALGLVRFTKWVSVLGPFIGIAILIYVAHVLSAGIIKPSEAIGGPIVTYDIFSGLVTSYPSFRDGLKISMLLSLVVGLSNLIPFLPFDGGNLAESLIRKVIGEDNYHRAKGVISAGLFVPGLLILALAIAGDVWHVLK